MTIFRDHLGSLAVQIADEVGRQISSAGLPCSLAGSISRQLAACGVEPGARSPSPFGLLVVLSYEAAGGDDSRPAIAVAAGAQFFVAAAEALDDLQDGDPVAGLEEQDPVAGAELIAALLTLSNVAFAGAAQWSDAPARVARASAAFSQFALNALGAQHAELASPGAAADEPDQARARVAGKSGSIGRAVCEAGARLATEDDALIERIGEFGHHWAVVDQLMDDISAVWPGGKPDRNLLNRRPTLPAVFASKAARESGIGDLFETFDGDPEDERALRSAIFESGAIHKTLAVAAVHHARAARIARDISSSNPQSGLQELLQV